MTIITAKEARIRHGRVAHRWVWTSWFALVAACLLAFGLWFVRGVVGGVPGPVISGVYVAGPVDAVIVVAYVVTGMALATIGAILVTRVPKNPIGWILGAGAVWLASTLLLIVSLYFLHPPEATETALANWLGDWTFVIPASLSLVLLIFPTGRVPSPRWRLLPWMGVIGVAGWVTIEATEGTLGVEQALQNPYANPGLNRVANLAAIVLLPALIGTIASLIVRYRGAYPEVRQQIKWVALGGLIAIVVWLLIWGMSVFRPDDFGSIAVAVGTLAGLITPVALTVAILRYRLYDIDHLVSRTVSYTVLAVLLAGAYFGGVIGLQTVFPSSGGFAVAGTTLGLAAVFNPLRHRLRDVVDRRFNRQRFDAERVIEGFTSRMSNVTTTDSLSSDLTATLEQTLAPAAIGIWIRT